MRLLTDARIPPSLSWDQVVPLISTDRRYGGLKSAGERKVVFNDYVQKRRAQEAEEARMQKAKVSTALLMMHFIGQPARRAVSY